MPIVVSLLTMDIHHQLCQISRANTGNHFKSSILNFEFIIGSFNLAPVVDACTPSHQNHIPTHHKIRHKPRCLAPASGNNYIY
jgi:hypothetical protein